MTDISIAPRKSEPGNTVERAGHEVFNKCSRAEHTGLKQGKATFAVTRLFARAPVNALKCSEVFSRLYRRLEVGLYLENCSAFRHYTPPKGV